MTETEVSHSYLEDPAEWAIRLTEEQASSLIIGPYSFDYNIAFSTNEGEVGRFEWADGTLKFTGKADESAKVFIDYLIKLWGVKEK